MNFGSGAAGGGGGVNAGRDLQEVETERLLCLAVAGEEKARLLPSAWTGQPPPPTSSLLSVAQKKGLVAAAGPDTLVLASTESLRAAYTTPSTDGNKVKSFSPQATISVPRLSQVAFSSDESCLVISAEQGGGLAIYETNALTNGGKDAAFQLATEGQSVRQLLPNPNPEASKLCGIVTSNGQLLLADLQERKLVSAANGSNVLKESVSCACWSRLGKQIITGLADGTGAQVDQAGNVKGTIPEPPQLAGVKFPDAQAYPITSIYWLETYDFITVHTPIYPAGADTNDHDSVYHLAHKDKASGAWTFSKLPDPCPPFGAERRPASHFIQRLRDWPPALTDMLILSSTASADIGLFSRSQRPMNDETPVVDAFNLTQPPEGRRPIMPMGAGGDTSPIGMAIDLSVKENAVRPIPGDDEVEQSPAPLPALYVLDHEGTLSMWWMVYTDSIRQNTPFPDLVAAGGPRPLSDKAGGSAQTTPAAAPSSFGTFGAAPSAAAAKPAFGTSTFGQSPAVAPANPLASAATKPAFGATSFGSASPMGATNVSTFAKPAAPAFGGPSAIGNQSPWGKAAAPSTFGSSGTPASSQSTFGQGTTFGSGSGFGQTGALGQSKSPWGGAAQQTAQTTQTGTGVSVFGGNASGASPFMSMGTGKTGDGTASSSPFAAFAKKDTQSSPFAAAKQDSQASPFGAKPSLSAQPSGSTVSFGTGSSFGSGTSLFGGQQTPSAFNTPAQTSTGTFGKPSATPASKEESMEDDAPAKPAADTSKSPFAMPSGGFKLGSTFKGDGSAKDDLPKPKDAGAGFFGNAFGNALGAAAQETPVIKKEPGTEEEPSMKDIPQAKSPSLTPKAAPKVQFFTNDAPLPPDPTTWKPKEGAPPPPIPPGFGDDFVKAKPKAEEKAEDAPLPPDFITRTSEFTKKTSSESEQPVAGSPPIDLGNEKFSEAAGSEEDGPPEDDDEVEWSEEEEDGEAEEDDDEGDDEDEDEDDDEGDEEEEAATGEDSASLALFKSRITPASPTRPPQSPEAQSSTTPATEKKTSYTPAGMPKPNVIFPASKAVQDSPRSPSPVRNATSPQRLMAQPFSSSRTKSPASPAAGMSRSRQTSQTSGISKAPPRRIAVEPAQLVADDKQQAKSTPKYEEPTAGQLEDDEDARVQAELREPVKPVMEVPAFLAHQDYVGSGQAINDPATSKSGLGGQIERVFRDINSMIDTLALNARGMQAFIAGNQAESDGDGKTVEDLEKAEDWALGDTHQLQDVMNALQSQLEEQQLSDVRAALDDIQDEHSETNRLRARMSDVRKQVNAHTDESRAREQLLAPLPLESATQQSEVRHGVQRVQTLLAKAEEQVSLLRAELAGHQAQQSPEKARKGEVQQQAVPTVEAVTNTILKMTAMIEKRSGDVDVLEAAIRRLGGLPSAAPRELTEGYEDELAGAMRASRLSPYGGGSPAAARKSVLRQSRFGTSMSSPGKGTPGGSARKQSLMQPDEEAVEGWRVRREARRRVCRVLRDEVLDGRKVRVTRVRDV